MEAEWVKSEEEVSGGLKGGVPVDPVPKAARSFPAKPCQRPKAGAASVENRGPGMVSLD